MPLLTSPQTEVMPGVHLSPKQKRFCELWLKYDGNGTQAALEVYNISAEPTASEVARENLRKPAIIEYMQILIKEMGFNDAKVEREHYRVLEQNKDLGSKTRAIALYYQLKGRLNEKKDQDTTVNVVFVQKPPTT